MRNRQACWTVLPELGAWATTGFTWAPEVIKAASGYVLYYTARSTDTGRQCVGAAVSATPEGPFADPSGKPLVCEADLGGSIDASPFRDADGTLYLYWKNDGNAIGEPTHLFGRRLRPDGLGFEGERAKLLTNSAPWHGHVIEAPQMVLHDGRHYLFYSANAYDKAEYAVGYATCDGPLGPCHDAQENPILASRGKAAGPGHSFYLDGRLFYHAWSPDSIGSVDPGRALWISRLDWIDGKPTVRS